MSLFTQLAGLEQNDALHEARLLVLLGAFRETSCRARIEGLTKLAKLDFLLRYPVYLERALTAKKLSPKAVDVTDGERQSIESKMVRFRYGPWDHRYRRFINNLVAKGLVELHSDGRTVIIALTDTGDQLSAALAADTAFSDVARRAVLLHRYFDLPGTTLMRFVYATFPEISSLRMNEEIAAGHDPEAVRAPSIHADQRSSQERGNSL
jgi:hypothetical protein